jgi:hypothetical protein
MAAKIRRDARASVLAEVGATSPHASRVTASGRAIDSAASEFVMRKYTSMPSSTMSRVRLDSRTSSAMAGCVFMKAVTSGLSWRLKSNGAPTRRRPRGSVASPPTAASARRTPAGTPGSARDRSARPRLSRRSGWSDRTTARQGGTQCARHAWSPTPATSGGHGRRRRSRSAGRRGRTPASSPGCPRARSCHCFRSKNDSFRRPGVPLRRPNL